MRPKYAQGESFTDTIFLHPTSTQNSNNFALCEIANQCSEEHKTTRVRSASMGASVRTRQFQKRGSGRQTGLGGRSGRQILALRWERDFIFLGFMLSVMLYIRFYVFRRPNCPVRPISPHGFVIIPPHPIPPANIDRRTWPSSRDIIPCPYITSTTSTVSAWWDIKFESAEMMWPNRLNGNHFPNVHPCNYYRWIVVLRPRVIIIAVAKSIIALGPTLIVTRPHAHCPPCIPVLGDVRLAVR